MKARFPYRLIYSIDANDIVIVALAHQHRHSGYWHGHVEEPTPTYAILLKKDGD